MREGSGQLVLREIEDRDLGVLFEHWTDPDAIRMAAFTSPDQNDRAAFESAARALTLGTPATSYILQSLAWVAGILLVFVPLAVRRYRRAV